MALNLSTQVLTWRAGANSSSAFRNVGINDHGPAADDSEILRSDLTQGKLLVDMAVGRVSPGNGSKPASGYIRWGLIRALRK